MTTAENKRLREASGSVDIDSRLVSFLYELMRDEVTPGVVEKLISTAHAEVSYTNGWLAEYARYCASRLQNSHENH